MGSKLKKSTIVIFVSIIFSLAYQNCSRSGFITHGTDGEESLSSEAPPILNDPVTVSSAAISSSGSELPKASANTACECEFDLKSYYSQGYTTTFYYDNGKTYEPDAATKVMRLPGKMKDQFQMTKGNKMVFFVCNKGVLKVSTWDGDSSAIVAQEPVLAVAKDCPNIECKFKLESGYTTTFVYANGKSYAPDAAGNMTLPGNFNPYQLNTYNSNGNYIYYQCEKGILTTLDHNIRIISIAPAY